MHLIFIAYYNKTRRYDAAQLGSYLVPALGVMCLIIHTFGLRMCLENRNLNCFIFYVFNFEV